MAVVPEEAPGEGNPTRMELSISGANGSGARIPTTLSQ